MQPWNSPTYRVCCLTRQSCIVKKVGQCVSVNVKSAYSVAADADGCQLHDLKSLSPAGASSSTRECIAVNGSHLLTKLVWYAYFVISL
eukprot:6209585-Pleurochrysis_carterae.AAC.1